MKKYIAFAAALVMALSLAACGTAASSAAPASSAPESAASSINITTMAPGPALMPADGENTVIEGCEGIVGTTQNGSMNHFEIVTDDGTTYGFDTADNTQFNLPDGLTDGIKVAVYFGGAALGEQWCTAIEVDDASVSGTTAQGNLVITAAAAQSPETASSIMNGMGDVITYTDGDVQVLNGTASNVSHVNFTLTTDDGTAYSLNVSDATEMASISDGDKVTVSAVGDLDGTYALISVAAA